MNWCHPALSLAILQLGVEQARTGRDRCGLGLMKSPGHADRVPAISTQHRPVCFGFHKLTEQGAGEGAWQVERTGDAKYAAATA